MAQSITLFGATYSDVPAVLLPKSTTGTARFDDTTIDTNAATAADIANGKKAVVNGSLITGTASGGGGSGIGTLLKTDTIGTVSTTSTTATDLSHNITVNGINDYDLLIVESSVDSVVNNRHLGTVRLIYLTADSTVGTKSGTAIATATWNAKISSQGVVTTRSNTTARGVYPYSASISNGNVTFVMYRCYNSTQTGTINGSYTTRVYGVKLYELIGG